MTAAQYQELKALFIALRDVSGAKRAELLEQCCGDDPELRRELERLLYAHDHDDGALRGAATEKLGGTGPSESTVVAAADSSSGPSFPGYHVVRELSRGGQGVVYRAIQQSTKRTVAIKVLREGHFASPAEVARFEREVQILGQLKHPNIVTIYDSGSVAGNAFYVMDYISGQPLDEYVQGRRDEGTKGRSEGSTGSRDQGLKGLLRLFAKVCEAVHVAHLRGIIHRDLKPSNIRVDTAGEPHILDFGLAKLAGQIEVHRSPLMTLTGQFLGSLPWSSPEQAEGIPSKIDIRTDVYSLGVILYQMLTGRFPYDVTGNMREVIERIVQSEPARPSARDARDSGASAAAGTWLRHSRSRSRDRRIDDDVDTIVLKCLAKERERRYQSAGELARDVRHYLAGEAIEAKRDSAWYMIRKLASRNIAATVVFASVVAILISGATVSAFMYRQAKAAETEQARVAAELTETLRRLNLASAVNPQRMALGWFLLEWSAGRLERAREIRDQLKPSAPEHAAMAFLLDDGYAPEKLLATLPADPALARFVIGERHLKTGQRDAASQAFAASLAADADNWLQAAIRARVEQLNAMRGSD